MSPPFSSLVPERPRRHEVLQENVEGAEKPPKAHNNAHFFDLPQEVRDKIYGNLLSTKVVRFWDRSHYRPDFSEGEMFSLLRSPWALDPTIVRVNRRIKQEASTFFYKSNLFLRFTLCAPASFADILLPEIAAHVTFHGSKPQLVEQCTQHAADVTISINQSLVKRSQIIMPYTSLTSLVTFLSTLCNVPNPEHIPFSNISLEILQTYGLSDDIIQQSLTEPWRKIFNIPQVSIRWEFGPPDYVNCLQKDMTYKGFDADAWLRSTTNLKDNGLRAFDNGVLEASIQYFAEALSSIRNVYEDKAGNRRAELLKKDAKFSKAVSRIRYICELNISMAWVNLENRFEQARRAALTAYRISQNSLPEAEMQNDPPNDADWYTDEDRATALFCYGSAAMALGAFENARDDFEEAQRLNPYDPGISRAVEQARRRLND